MKIVLTQLLGYAPAKRGGARSNRLLLEALTARGHTCHAVLALSETGTSTYMQNLPELVAEGADLQSDSDDVSSCAIGGVNIVAFRPRTFATIESVVAKVRDLSPDWIFVSCEDYRYMMLELACQIAPSRVVYVAHMVTALPFGPAATAPSAHATELLQSAAGVVTVSAFMKSYLETHGQLASTVLRFPVYGKGPFEQLSNFDKGFVTIINPGSFKGISIFLEMARRMPDVAFAAVPNPWDTTRDELDRLRACNNVAVLERQADIGKIFAQTKVLLAPSVGEEALGLVVIEAMLRGVPVLVSSAGGLPEAGLGVAEVVPVAPVRWGAAEESGAPPIAEVPAQDVEPWCRATRRLLDDKGLYEERSRAGREAALAFVAAATTESFESHLASLARRA